MIDERLRFKLQTLLFLPLFFITDCGSEDRRTTFLVGEEPAQAVHSFDNHFETYLRWLESGQEDRTVIHFDSHIDVAPMTDSELKSILSEPDVHSAARFVQHPYDYYIPDRRFLTVANWLYPAMKGDMITKLIWVVPDDSLSLIWVDALKLRLRNHLYDLTREEIESFRLVEHVIEGKMYGTEIIITSVEDLPRVTEPVLLDFDIDYYSFDSAVRLNRLGSPKHTPLETVAELRRKGITADVVTISTSVPNGYTSLRTAYLAQDLRDLLRLGSAATSDFTERLHQWAAGDSCMAAGDFEAAIALYQADTDGQSVPAGILFNLATAYERLVKETVPKNCWQKRLKLILCLPLPSSTNSMHTSMIESTGKC